MKLLRGDIKCCTLVVALQSVIILAILWLLVSFKRESDARAGRPPVEVRQEANPEIVTNVEAADRSEAIWNRASRRGHFTRAEFAEYMEYSVSTIDRMIKNGKLSPPPIKTESGDVIIDLETVLLGE